jgi:tRNA A-37 threonylcarbamoyl transferase component Bud32
MSAPDPSSEIPADPLDAVIAAYLQQVEAGVVPDREALLATHPDLAERLRAFFADYDRVDRQAAGLHLSNDPNRTVDGPQQPGSLPRVRYIGDYELLEEIARGGMGVVYKARQITLNRIVALKMILHGELATPMDVARFRAEAEAAATLDHPNIVPIYEVGTHEGQQYYAMRYVEGTSLARHPCGDARAEARLLAAVTQAVDHAHRRGILHRDLKPSNILLDLAGTPFVTDFGLAKRVDAERSLTETGALVGTPRYVAPEQAAGQKNLTLAADVYSLGVVLYERLTGRTPFTGETVLEVLRQVREAEPPRPSSIQPGLDRDLETICLKCLEKDPAKRYGTAAALADDLDRFLRGEPIQARPVGQMERLWRWCRRNPAVASLTAVVVVVLLVAVVVSTDLAIWALGERDRANGERDRADSRTREVEKAGEQLERTLARSLEGPLREDRTGEEMLTDPESEALWELAESPSERLGNWFITEALARPLSTSQLVSRSEPALIAALGLDAGRRARAERALVEQMSDDSLPLRQRAEIAWLALDLAEPHSAAVPQALKLIARAIPGEQDKLRQDVWRNCCIARSDRFPPTTAARLLAEVLAKETGADTRQRLAECLSAVAGRLPPAEAAAICGPPARLLGEALAKETNATARGSLAKGLWAIAGRLPPAEAEAVCGPPVRLLAEALGKETDATARRSLAEGLSAIAGRLPPTEAARLLDEALAKEKDGMARYYLAEGLSAIAGRLPPTEGARLLAEALAKEKDHNARWGLARGLASMAGRQPSAEAARLLAEALAKGLSGRPDLAEGLAAAADRLPPAESAAVCGPPARLLAEALAKEKDPNTRWGLAASLSEVARRLPPAEAAAICGPPARLLAEALAKERNAEDRRSLAKGLSMVAGRLPAAEAAAICGPPARLLSEALAKETNPNDRCTLAGSLAAVAGGLPPAEAVHLLVEALAKARTDTLPRWLLAEGLSAVAGRLPPAEGARLLVEALGKETDALACVLLAKGLVIATGRVERTEAERICEQALFLVGQREMSETSWEARRGLQETASVLVQQLAEDKARGMALQQARQTAASLYVNTIDEFLSYSYSPVDTLDRLLSEAPPDHGRRGIVAMATAVGLACGNPLPALVPVMSASGPLPCRMTTPELVELLKYPTCFGRARQVVLKHLGNRYGRTFANHWEFVRFAQENHLDLDFTSPPKRPDRR